MRWVFKYLGWQRILLDKSQKRLHNEYSVIFSLTCFVDLSESEIFEVVSYFIVCQFRRLRPFEYPPIFLSHLDLPKFFAEVPVFNDIDSPSLLLLISTWLFVIVWWLLIILAICYVTRITLLSTNLLSLGHVRSWVSFPRPSHLMMYSFLIIFQVPFVMFLVIMWVPPIIKSFICRPSPRGGPFS
jgi:hypothetical protein